MNLIAQWQIVGYPACKYLDKLKALFVSSSDIAYKVSKDLFFLNLNPNA